MEVRGRDLLTGLPRNLEVSAEEIREALTEPVRTIVDAVKTTLETTPPELSADIVDRGITLTGGGAFLKGLNTLLSKETLLPVYIAEDPLCLLYTSCGTTLIDTQVTE